MGTNYYFKKSRKHIGKNSWLGGEMGTFCWDMNPKDFYDPVYALKQGVIVCDEYGRTYSYAKFKKLLEHRYHNMDSIGKGFC